LGWQPLPAVYSLATMYMVGSGAMLAMFSEEALVKDAQKTTTKPKAPPREPTELEVLDAMIEDSWHKGNGIFWTKRDREFTASLRKKRREIAAEMARPRVQLSLTPSSTGAIGAELTVVVPEVPEEESYWLHLLTRSAMHHVYI
jgi:hypothetical protein